MKRILLVDSEPKGSETIRDRLRSEGYEVVQCETVAQTIGSVREGADVVVVCRCPQGIVSLLSDLDSADAELPVIVACSSHEETLDALNRGAFYVTRAPINADEVVILVRRAIGNEDRARRLSSPPSGEVLRPTLIGETPEIRTIRGAIDKLNARPTTPVLIIGESGVGKHTVARLLHAQTGQGGPFVDLTGLGASEASLEAELFGSDLDGGKPGLLEQADGGTLFLGEITDIPLPLQSKLLRFVQEKAFRRVGAQTDSVSQARVVATSTRALDAAVRDGLLKSELAYRLAVVTLEIPPLRDRRADIPLLVEYFAAALASKAGKPLRVSESAMKRLAEHSWPGNVRELANVVESAALLADTDRLDLQHLPAVAGGRSGVDYRLPSQGIDFRELEREVLAQALRLASGNQTRAASLLGLTRDQIRYRMAKFGMTSRDAARAA